MELPSTTAHFNPVNAKTTANQFNNIYLFSKQNLNLPELGDPHYETFAGAPHNSCSPSNCVVIIETSTSGDNQDNSQWLDEPCSFVAEGYICEAVAAVAPPPPPGHK